MFCPQSRNELDFISATNMHVQHHQSCDTRGIVQILKSINMRGCFVQVDSDSSNYFRKVDDIFHEVRHWYGIKFLSHLSNEITSLPQFITFLASNPLFVVSSEETKHLSALSVHIQ